MIIERTGPRNVLVRNPALTDNELNEIRRQSLGVSLRDAAIIEDGVPGVESLRWPEPSLRIFCQA